jgi:hypothetical protein
MIVRQQGIMRLPRYEICAIGEAFGAVTEKLD